MKNIVLAAVAASALFATQAHAGTISAEARFGDIRGGQHPDSTEYVIDYAAPLNKLLSYGAEVDVKQKNGAGDVSATVAGRVGPNLPTVLGFHTQAYGEFGQKLNRGDDFVFWGAGVNTTRNVYGPVAATVGYRHRESFNGTGRLDEDRVNGGLELNIGSGNAVAVNYYRTSGTTRSDAVGVGFNHTF